MRVLLTFEFRLDVRKAPRTVADWALDWVETAEAPGCTFAELTEGAKKLRSKSGNVYSRRRRGHRLIFRANPEKNEATFVAVRQRADVYEVAAERIGE